MEIEENAAVSSEPEKTVKSRRSVKDPAKKATLKTQGKVKKSRKKTEKSDQAPDSGENRDGGGQGSAEIDTTETSGAVLPDQVDLTEQVNPAVPEKTARKLQRSGRKRKTAVAQPEVTDEADPGEEASQGEDTGPAQAEAPQEGTRRRSRGRQRAQRSEARQAEPSPAQPDSAAPTVVTAEEPGSSGEGMIMSAPLVASTPASLLFQAPDLSMLTTAYSGPSRESETELEELAEGRQRRRSRGRRGKTEPASEQPEPGSEDLQGAEGQEGEATRRRRRRRRGDSDIELSGGGEDDPPNTITRVRAPRSGGEGGHDKVAAVKGSTRLEAKKQRRRESRENGRRQIITEAEFLARRESVDRVMVVRQRDHRIQIGVLEDGVLAEHFVSRTQQDSLIGNVYLGKVQNVLPSMEAAFVDIGRGRNAVLYAGEVTWDAAKLGNSPRRIENILKSGDAVLVQVTKDPVGQKGARLTSQISLPGRYLVYVPGGSMTGISRKLPDVERNRLKRILKDNLPEDAGVIVRTAAEGASEQELVNDINRLRAQWENIQSRAESKKTLAPELLYAEPDLTIKVVRDVFNEDFSQLVVSGAEAWDTIEAYVTYVAPDLLGRLRKWGQEEDIFAEYRVTEQINKALDRKVFLPSGGSLVIDRTEAMTVIDVNTGKFTGSGGNLEETVTKNNLEAAEEVVRQLRLRDIGGIIVIDFIDMVLESNRDLVLRRLVECLGRDRTKHQVAEVTSLGLVQMTRKRMGTGLLEVFGEQCEACSGRGVMTHEEPVEHRTTGHHAAQQGDQRNGSSQPGGKESRSEKRRNRRKQNSSAALSAPEESSPVQGEDSDEEKAAQAEANRQAFAAIAAAAMAAHQLGDGNESGRGSETHGSETHGGGDSEQGSGGLSDADDAQAVLTFGSEKVELPRADSRPEQPVEAVAEAPAFTLDRLSDVFDHLTPEDGQEKSNQEKSRRDNLQNSTDAALIAEESAASPARPVRKRRVAGRAQGAANTTRLETSSLEPSEVMAEGAEAAAAEPTQEATAEAAAAGTQRKSRTARPRRSVKGSAQGSAQAPEVAEPLILGVGVPASEL